MSYFLQLVVSGIVVGSIYALSALGFVLIYKSSRVLNIAHGQIIAAGAFITYALTVWVGIPIYLSFGMSMIATFFLAMSVERIFLRRLIGEPIISVIVPRKIGGRDSSLRLARRGRAGVVRERRQVERIRLGLARVLG